MKIIYYSPHPHLNLMSPSGYGTHMREMITAFEGEGCEVLPVVMGGEDNPPEEKLQEEKSGKNFLKRIIPNNVWRTLKDFHLFKFDRRAKGRLEKEVQNFDPDFIYERCNYLQLSGLKVAQKHSIPHVIEINSPYVQQKNDMSKNRSYIEKYARYAEKKQIQNTDIPLAVVGPLRDYFSQQYGVDSDRFLVTHDAFNKNNIQLNADHQQQIIKEHDLSDQTIIGFIGSIFEWHGLDKLIKAYDELNPPNTKLLIVGYGEYMVNLIELTKKLHREEDVIFTGRVPKEEIFDYIQIMDICAAPNAAWYQSPIKIFEYGALAKPILGPNTEAVREIMDHGGDGFLVEPTKEGVRNGLKTLLDDPKLGSKMGSHFQKKVLHKYTWQNNARKVLEAIRKL